MSSRSWQNDVRQALRRVQPPDRPLRLAVVGLGHELRGDDVAGLLVARRLRAGSLPQTCLVLDAGSVPESCTGPLRRFHPDLVVLVDAAYLEAPPGTVRWLDDWRADGPGMSTHTLPLSVLADYVRRELACPVALLAIQPAATDFDVPISTAVHRAVLEIARGLRAAAGQSPVLFARG
jgi:hydrogenase 3 maturation protease